METSSHSLDQGRLDGLTFAAGVFTNLTRDHLDYHGTMEAYLAAKLRLSALLGPAGVEVVNADDPAWDALPPCPPAGHLRPSRPTPTCAPRRSCSTPAGAASASTAGSGRADVRLPLLGDFNVSNALAAAATRAGARTCRSADVAARLAASPQVPGRMERLADRPDARCCATTRTRPTR